MRTSSGCWTCRLRRKKCDQNHPICHACAALHITCHNDLTNKPAWMDGGARQKDMAKQLAREVKERSGRFGLDEVTTANKSTELTQEPAGHLNKSMSNSREMPENIHHDTMRLFAQESDLFLKRGLDHAHHKVDDDRACGRPDASLISFFLDNLLPFLYPFYRPSLTQGGRAWILEMMARPAIRQVVLCQSVCYVSLALEDANDRDSDKTPDGLLARTADAFQVLRQALKIIEGLRIPEHVDCAVRILASIVQLQRFTINVLSLTNWKPHLDAALAIFAELLDGPGALEVACHGFSAGECKTRYTTVMSKLGSSSWTRPTQMLQLPSAEQAAFRFASSLVIFDDIIASTVLQERPRLYAYHRSLLCASGTDGPLVDTEAVLGIKNWIVLELGEIASLDAWKQRCTIAGNLNVLELARRATIIKESLLNQLMRLDGEEEAHSSKWIDPFENLTRYNSQPSSAMSSQSSVVNQIWAHASLIYLLVVVSGWQPTNSDIRYHVNSTVELLQRLSRSEMLRTVVWPFCVAGCLAEPNQESQLRHIVEKLRPSLFATLHHAFNVMETVWHNKHIDHPAPHDFACCFQHQGKLVLLV